MKYRCIKDFDLEKVDDNYFGTGEFEIIEKGSIWERNDDSTDLRRNSMNGVLLENGGYWMAIDHTTLKECFEQIGDE